MLTAMDDGDFGPRYSFRDIARMEQEAWMPQAAPLPREEPETKRKRVKPRQEPYMKRSQGLLLEYLGR
jgi:hypothetical protein